MNATGPMALSVGAFERGEIDPNTFDHETHVYLAWLYLEKFQLPEALARFDAALRRLTLQLGIPGKYHATITWFFLLLIAERRAVDPGGNWPGFRRRNADLVEDRGLLERYYHRQTLASNRARQVFVLPDRFMTAMSNSPGSGTPVPARPVGGRCRSREAW